MLEDSYDKVFGNKQRIMVVMAHPDDLEIFCGGTVARLIADGKSVRSVKLTLGDRGSRDRNISRKELSTIRHKEDEQAMETIGISRKDSVYLGLEDGAVDNSLDVIGKISLQIRLFKPQIVITTNPEDIIVSHHSGDNWVNHRDHRNAALSAIDAVYPFSRDRLYFPEHFKKKGVGYHECNELLLADYYSHKQTIAIKVDDYINTRIKAMSCHKSQITPKHAQESTDYFTKHPGSKGRLELFRYVIAD